MIISASRRTDIPALHGRWFMDKIRRGFCLVKNPFNAQTVKVSLALPDVDGIVFWSRNFQPMLDDFHALRKTGYRFYFQLTLTGYPSLIEPYSPSVDKSINTAQQLAKKFGPKAIVWRYDPIMLTSVTDRKWQIKNFTALANLMEELTDTCVVSFIDKYRKLERNLFPLLAENSIEYHHPRIEELDGLAVELASIAKIKGITVESCCEPWIDTSVIARTSCIDISRIEDVSGEKIEGAKRAPTRPACQCYRAGDIGSYDTCSLGCAYCYANHSRQKSVTNIKTIKPNNPALEPE